MKELRKQDAWGLGRPRVMIFDVNETLIDFQSLNPLFEKTFGDEKVLREWLGHLILYSMTLTMSGLYKDYWDIGRGVFRMVGGIHKIDVTEDDVEALKKGMRTMPAWPDCKEGLTKLKDAGFRLVTLTNSPPPTSGSKSPPSTPASQGCSRSNIIFRKRRPISRRRSSITWSRRTWTSRRRTAAWSPPMFGTPSAARLPACSPL